MNSLLAFDCQFAYPSGFALDAQFEADQLITALCGPSGSGKTTILSLICGLLQPRSGTIRVGDTVVTDTSANILMQPEQRRLGILFQDDRLFPHRRVRANILYGSRRNPIRKVPFNRVVDALDLTAHLDAYPDSLSGGQRQRVALARALVAAPAYLLLDEPLTAVESELRDSIADFIEELVTEFQIPALLISHNRGLVQRIAQRVISIDRGRIGQPLGGLRAGAAGERS